MIELCLGLNNYNIFMRVSAVTANILLQYTITIYLRNMQVVAYVRINIFNKHLINDTYNTMGNN